MFLADIHVKVIATDGYFKAFDTFTIGLKAFSFMYFINFMFKIGGGLLGLFGFYKYRSMFYNLFMYNKVMRSKEVVYIDNFYMK